MVVPFLDSGCRLGNAPPHTHTRETPQNRPITRQDGRLASPTRLVPVTSADEVSDLGKGDRRSGCSVLEVARFSFGQSCGIGLVRFGYASGGFGLSLQCLW